MKRKVDYRGQSSLEYTILIVILISALLAIGLYFKRSVQGRWKESADSLGDPYDPRYTSSDSTYQTSMNSVTTVVSVPLTSAPDSKKYTQRIDTSNITESKEGETTVRYYGNASN